MSSELDSLIQELRGDYLKSFPEKIARLNQLYTDNNRAGLENEFHKIKGTGKTYGVPEMSVVAGHMETICRHNVDILNRCFPKAIEVIKEIEQAYKVGLDLALDNIPSYCELLKLTEPQ